MKNLLFFLSLIFLISATNAHASNDFVLRWSENGIKSEIEIPRSQLTRSCKVVVALWLKLMRSEPYGLEYASCQASNGQHGFWKGRDLRRVWRNMQG